MNMQYALLFSPVIMALILTAVVHRMTRKKHS